jgi:predicted amidophosphoribosyltransferase
VTNEPDKTKDTGEEQDKCVCPFCDAPLEIIRPLCKVCGVTITFCESCGKPIPKGKSECPECGA